MPHYFDVNKLYGCAMSQSLPVSGVRWIEKEEEVSVMGIVDDSLTDCVLQVDIAYLKELHDLYNDHPLAAETIKANKYPNSKHFRE